MIAWSEVKKTHKTVAGIYSKAGVAVSLLCNSMPSTQRYPNCVSPKSIIYYLGTDTQSFGIKALLKALELKREVRVFQKLGINQWHDLGDWLPVGVGEERDGFWPVKLVQS